MGPRYAQMQHPPANHRKTTTNLSFYTKELSDSFQLFRVIRYPPIVIGITKISTRERSRHRPAKRSWAGIVIGITKISTREKKTSQRKREEGRPRRPPQTSEAVMGCSSATTRFHQSKWVLVAPTGLINKRTSWAGGRPGARGVGA